MSVSAFVGFLSLLWVLAVSSSKNMGGPDDGGENSGVQGSGDEREDTTTLRRNASEASLYTTEDEEDEQIELGPQYTLKEQIEKDKDDASLAKWKEQLLGSVDVNAVGEGLEPDVMILSLSILSPDREDIVLSIPEDGKPKGPWFTLKEGSNYKLKFCFKVSRNIVSGFRYTNTVWKTGVKVDSTKQMLGTFSPRQEPYAYEVQEETTPSGFFARGQYTARSRFVDDDCKCYLEINYTFDIRKDWATPNE